MSLPTVVHWKKEPYDLLIARPSKWGNPYTHLKDRHTKAEFVVGSRQEAITKYRAYILASPLYEQLEELRGKRLGCWCAPKKCHGDVLVELLRERDRSASFMPLPL